MSIRAPAPKLDVGDAHGAPEPMKLSSQPLPLIMLSTGNVITLETKTDVMATGVGGVPPRFRYKKWERVDSGKIAWDDKTRQEFGSEFGYYKGHLHLLVDLLNKDDGINSFVRRVKDFGTDDLLFNTLADLKADNTKYRGALKDWSNAWYSIMNNYEANEVKNLEDTLLAALVQLGYLTKIDGGLQDEHTYKQKMKLTEIGMA